MKMFIVLFLLITLGTLLLIYVPEVRSFVKSNLKKVLLTVTTVSILLFVLFVAMSTSTWRLF